MESRQEGPITSPGAAANSARVRALDRLLKMSLWRLVWMTVFISEALTALMNVAVSYVLWGAPSTELVYIGVVDAFVVSVLAASFLIFIVLRLRESEKAEDLDRREREYAHLMAEASDGIFIHDRDGKITEVNKKACEMLGRSRAEILGMRMGDLMSADDIATTPLRLDEIFAGETIFSDRRFVRKDGGIIHVESTVRMIDKGKVLAIARDVTARKQAEAEKEHMQAALFKAQKMEAIGTLAGGVAHDFNNLLTVIKGEAEMALADLNESDPMYFHVRQIGRAAGRAADLTKKLLHFGRKQPIEPRPMDLNKSVRDMLEMLRRIIGEDVTTEVSLQEGLQAVLADASSMEQVIMNLVVNARDSMPGGGTLTINTGDVALDNESCRTLPDSRPGKFVCLTVSDTGTGMTGEMMQHIFDPFYSAGEHRKGTGLGLSVVYGIVDQHGGWINVASEPGKGSTFRVYLEACLECEPEEAAEVASLDVLRGAGERVLLVEDEEGVSFFASKALRQNGYTVTVAPDAEEAMRVFEAEKGRFDVVFSDVVLPGKSGVDLAEHLRLVVPGLPVILSSGYADQKSQWPIIKERGYRFLEKPYQIHDLLRSVKDAVSGHGKSG